MILLADSKGQDQTAQMRSRIWVFTVRIFPKTLSHVAAQTKVITHFGGLRNCVSSNISEDIEEMP